MSKSALLKALILLSIFLIGLMLPPTFNAKANPMIYRPGYETVQIQSPQNKTYNTNSLSLNFTSKTNLNPSILVYYYTLDGNATILYGKISNKLLHVEQKVTNQITESKDPFDPAYYYYYYPTTQYTIECNAVLPALSDGWHNITIYRGSNYGENYSIHYKPYSTAYFKIDTSNSMPENSSTSLFIEIEPFPTTLVIGMIATILAVLGIFSYLKYRRGETR